MEAPATRRMVLSCGFLRARCTARAIAEVPPRTYVAQAKYAQKCEKHAQQWSAGVFTLGACASLCATRARAAFAGAAIDFAGLLQGMTCKEAKNGNSRCQSPLVACLRITPAAPELSLLSTSMHKASPAPFCFIPASLLLVLQPRFFTRVLFSPYPIAPFHHLSNTRGHMERPCAACAHTLAPTPLRLLLT
eukprot:1161319-Pelagomonas_calceolata.AAC.3